MNVLLCCAAVRALLVGIVHSVLGERLVFSRMRARSDGLVPTNGAPLLREKHVRILWATWHLASVFGWAMSALLLWLALEPRPGGAQVLIERAVTVAMVVGSLLVFIGTRARHPGWVGLLGVAVLVWLS